MRDAVYLALVLTAASVGCAHPCENEVVQRELRPGGPYRAVLFNRDCGATTAYSTHVSILGVKELTPAGTGNVFVMESGGSADPMARVAWLDRDTLEIRHDAGQVFRKESSWEGISIVYSPLGHGPIRRNRGSSDDLL